MVQLLKLRPFSQFELPSSPRFIDACHPDGRAKKKNYIFIAADVSWLCHVPFVSEFLTLKFLTQNTRSLLDDYAQMHIYRYLQFEIRHKNECNASHNICWANADLRLIFSPIYRTPPSFEFKQVFLNECFTFDCTIQWLTWTLPWKSQH